MDFLTLLRDDIREGLAKTSPDFRARHTAWILAQQCPEGGFANRRGKVDLYYTGFALRSLSALNELSASVATNSAYSIRSWPSSSRHSLNRSLHVIVWFASDSYSSITR